MAYLTGDSLIGDNINWNIAVSSDQWVALALQWAIVQLTNPDNWLQGGFYTPQDAASYFSDVYKNMFITPNPTGSIMAYAGDPTRFGSAVLLCDGSSYLKSDFSALYDVIGSVYGGDSTHFNVPDLRGRLLIGSGSVVNGVTLALGVTGGASTHTQTLSELATHDHTDAGHSHGYLPALANATTIGAGVPQPTAVPGIASTSSGNAAISSSGSSSPMDIMNPYGVVNYLIVTGLTS